MIRCISQFSAIILILFVSFIFLFLHLFLNHYSSIVRIYTISKMSLFSVVSSQKFTIILKNFDDWDEWFLIIETMIKRDKIEKFVNLIIIESDESVKSSSFIFFDFVNDVTSSASSEKLHDLVILRENYKKLLRTYKERIEALKILDLFVLISIDRTNLLYLRDKATIFQKLLALKKRLASIDRIKELEIIRRYKNLLRVFKHQQLNHWLLNWKKMYAKIIRLKISDVQEDRCLYDFLNALRIVDVTFVVDKKTILNYEIQQEKSSSFILIFWRNFAITCESSRHYSIKSIIQIRELIIQHSRLFKIRALSRTKNLIISALTIAITLKISNQNQFLS